MSSVLSNLGRPQLLGLGLAVGVGVGAAVSAKGKAPVAERDTAAEDEANERTKVVEAEREAMAALCQESERKIVALQERQSVLEKELLTSGEQLKSQGNAEAAREAAERKVNALEKEQGAMRQEAQKCAKVAAELQDAQSQIEALKTAQAKTDALRFQAVRQVETLREEQDALQRTVASGEQKHRSEVSSLSQKLSDAQMALDASTAEQGNLREKLKHASDSERQVKHLQAELNEAQKNLEEAAVVATRFEAVQQEVKALEAELEPMRQKAEKGEKAVVELEETRQQFEALATERDRAQAQFEKADLAAKSLDEFQASLQKELAVTKRKRKDSMKDLAQSLSYVSAQLDNAEGSWSPWKDINGAKERLGSMQLDAAGDDEDDLLRGA